MKTTIKNAIKMNLTSYLRRSEKQFGLLRGGKPAETLFEGMGSHKRRTYGKGSPELGFTFVI